MGGGGGGGEGGVMWKEAMIESERHVEAANGRNKNEKKRKKKQMKKKVNIREERLGMFYTKERKMESVFSSVLEMALSAFFLSTACALGNKVLSVSLVANSSLFPWLRSFLHFLGNEALSVSLVKKFFPFL